MRYPCRQGLRQQQCNEWHIQMENAQRLKRLRVDLILKQDWEHSTVYYIDVSIFYPKYHSLILRFSEAGTIFILSTISTSSIEEIAEAAPTGIKWFQLYIYNDREVTKYHVSSIGEPDIIEYYLPKKFILVCLFIDSGYQESSKKSGKCWFQIPGFNNRCALFWNTQRRYS